MMRDVLKRSPSSLVVAVLMHLAIVALMLFGLDWLIKPEVVQPKVNIVQAQLVDSAELEESVKAKEQEKKQQEEKQKQEAEAKSKAEAEKKRQAEEADKKRKQDEAERQRKVEEDRLKKVELEKQAKEEERKKLEELEKKRQAEDEAKKKVEAEKKKAEEEAKKKAEEEAKKKADEEAKKKAEAEKKRKAEEEAKKKAEAERKKRQLEIDAQMAAEGEASEAEMVMAAIQTKIQRNWLRPPGAAESGLKCTVRVRLNEKGSVLGVQVVESSGNDGFDRSVEKAVYKSDPLPMPQSSGLKDRFRDINFIFDPTR